MDYLRAGESHLQRMLSRELTQFDSEYVAPLGSTSLIFNFLFASFLVGSPVTSNDIYVSLPSITWALPPNVLRIPPLM